MVELGTRPGLHGLGMRSRDSMKDRLGDWFVETSDIEEKSVIVYEKGNSLCE